MPSPSIVCPENRNLLFLKRTFFGKRWFICSLLVIKLNFLNSCFFYRLNLSSSSWGVKNLWHWSGSTSLSSDMIRSDDDLVVSAKHGHIKSPGQLASLAFWSFESIDAGRRQLECFGKELYVVQRVHATGIRLPAIAQDFFVLWYPIRINVG